MKGLGCCSRDTGHIREPAPPLKIVCISVVVMLIYPFLYCRLEVISRSLVAPRSQLSGAHYMQQRHDPHSIFPNVVTILNVCAYSIIYSGLARSRRSEEHTSELQSLMRISYAVFCLKKKNKDI